MIKTKFYVHSDIDDNNIFAEFNNSVDAISYAAGFSPMDKCYVVEATVDVDDESNEVLRELESKTIWTYEDLPTEDAFDVEDWPEIKYEENSDLLDNSQLTDDELLRRYPVKKAHEELEAKEDLVECQHCFDLFPKEECTKIEYGYLCPHCHSLVIKEVEIPTEMVDDATFGLEFPEPYDFDDDGDEDEIEDNGATTGLLTTASDAPVPEIGEQDVFVSEEEPEAVNIEAPVDFAEIPVTVEGSELDDGSSDDSSDDSDDILDEHVQDRPAPIEDKTELHGMDNAVVDCQTDMKVIAHSEDEKPLDCLMKKPALEEPLAGEKVNNLEITEDFENELIAFAASLPEDLNEKVLDEGILDKLGGVFKKVGSGIGAVANGIRKGIIESPEEKLDTAFKDVGYYIWSKKEGKDGETDPTKYTKINDALNVAKPLSKQKDIEQVQVMIDKGENSQLVIKLKAGKEVENNIKEIVKNIDLVAKETAAREKAKKEEKPAEDAPKAEEKPAEEKSAEEEPKAKRDMSKQNEARAQYKKIEKALEILNVNKDILRDKKDNKVTQTFKDLRKVLFTESYPDMPFDSDVQEGNKIRIIHLVGEDDSYNGKEGIVERIDGIGQLHGTWGSLAVIPGVDEFEIINECLKESAPVKATEWTIQYYNGKEEKTTDFEAALEKAEDMTEIQNIWADNGDYPYWTEEEGLFDYDEEAGIVKSEYTESLKEAKKDDEEAISPEEAKLEAHTMLNQLVADEIEAIDGYEASKAELVDKPLEHKEEIIHTIDHIKDEEKEHIDELINATKKIPFEKPAVEDLENPFDQDFEELEEASSAEKRAYKDGGEAYADYIQGKAIARIKDKDMRDAAVALAKADADRAAIGRFTGDRKEDQAIDAFDKKQMKMQAAGIAEDLHKNEEALVAEWARQGVETGMIFDESDYDQFAKVCKIEGIEPSEDLFKHYFKCIDDLVGVKEESLEFTCDQDLEDNRTPIQEEPKDFEKPVDGNEMRKHEHAIEEDADVNYVEYMHSYCNALEPHMDELRKIEDVEELKKAILDIVEKDSDVNTTEKKNKFVYIIKNKKWGSAKSIIKYLENAIKKAQGIEVTVDDNGELIKEDFEEETEICAWCGDEYPTSELHKEVDLGYLCPGCEQAIKSRGEKLTFEESKGE